MKPEKVLKQFQIFLVFFYFIWCNIVYYGLHYFFKVPLTNMGELILVVISCLATIFTVNLFTGGDTP